MEPSLNHGRCCVALAAVLWSTSGAWTKVLTNLMPAEYGFEAVAPLQIAFYRVFFAGLVLVPTLKRADLGWRPSMLAMVLCFATMNGLYVTAMAEGTAANAVLLQYTAPMWMYVASIGLLGESADRRGIVVLLLGMTGIGIIVAGGWDGGQLPVILMGLGSGVTYAGILTYLRYLRALSSRWLTVWNHLGGAVALVPFTWSLPPLAWEQIAVLFLFGATQMGLAYWLVARGLRVVSPQEAGTITLLEPLLNPLWAYLVWPATETPQWTTFLGGALIMLALVGRYVPLWSRGGATP